MTNKEAIKLFRFYQGEIICDKEMKEALDLAIKALEVIDLIKFNAWALNELISKQEAENEL